MEVLIVEQQLVFHKMQAWKKFWNKTYCAHIVAMENSRSMSSSIFSPLLYLHLHLYLYRYLYLCLSKYCSNLIHNNCTRNKQTITVDFQGKQIFEEINFLWLDEQICMIIG